MENIAIITGATRGLGKEIAKEFLKAGENVCLVARTEADLQKVKKQFDKISNKTILTYAGDVSDETFVKKLYKDLSKKWQISCLVNNAGVGRFGFVEQNNRKMLDEIFPGLVYGTILMTSYALPYMKQNNEITKIVNIISQSGLRAFKFESAYCSAKWAQRGFAECVRAETFGTNIKVINVYPGGIDTGFWYKNRNYVKKGLEKTFAKPDELAKMIVDNLYNKESLILKDLIVEQTHMNLE